MQFYLAGQCKTRKAQVTNINTGLYYVSCAEASELFLHVFSSAYRWGAVFPFHLLAACLRCHLPNMARTGHHQSAWSRCLFNTADPARLRKAFVLWGLPKILTVLGRDSTLILGTFSFSFPW